MTIGALRLHSSEMTMNPIFATTCSIASSIFGISQSLSQDPARKTRGVFFVSEGTSAHIQSLVCEASLRPEAAYDIPDQIGTAKRMFEFTPLTDVHRGCVEHIERSIRANCDAIFHIGGFDNLNLWERASLLTYFASGEIGTVFPAGKVSLADATFIVRTSSGSLGEVPSFETFLKTFQIAASDAADMNFYCCFE